MIKLRWSVLSFSIIGSLALACSSDTNNYGTPSAVAPSPDAATGKGTSDNDSGGGGSNTSGSGGGNTSGSGGSNTSGSGGSNTDAAAETGGGRTDGGGISTAADSSSEATAAEGGPATGTTSDCASDAIFCETFEGLAAGAVAKGTAYSPVTMNGTLTVDAVHARGKQALHVHTEGNGKAYLQVSPFAPNQNSFFARAYIWVTAFPTAPDYAHYTLVEASGTPAGVVRPIGGQYIPGKGSLWGVGSDSGPTGDWTNWKESAPGQGGKWQCVEWEMDASRNAVNVWFDGTAQTDLSVDTKNHGGTAVDFVFPTFSSIWFGWWLYQSGTTPAQFDIWFDDIAIASKRLGC